MSIPRKKLPITALERIDDICAQFELQWQAETPPSIESLISQEPAGPARDVLLTELIALDVDYRRRRGEETDKKSYLDRFPEDAPAVQDALNDHQQKTGTFPIVFGTGYAFLAKG